ncbi:MAG: Y-family DNA polymerase [Alphaproteobacteria bacterium]|nr:Y-family DNA polymerase [Alphaproteobacteria bacterium]
MYALADCNTFYASCEKAFRPDLARKPVVVLSNNDGCVIALSNEAKALGLKMGSPYFQVKELCQRQGVVAFSSNYELYADMSARVMETLRELVPDVEVYSIDEAFLDLDRMPHVDLHAFARHLRKTVSRNTGIPVSIGVGTTKTLAKAANRYAKRKTTDFAWTIDTEEERQRILTWLETGDVWGIGHRLQARLAAMGVHTAWDFANLDSRVVRKTFSVTVQRVLWELQGTRCYGIAQEKPKKEIICSRAFGRVIYSSAELEQAVAKYVARAAEKLRSQQGYTQRVVVYAEGSNRFKDDLPWYYSTLVGLPRPTANTGELITACTKAAHSLFEKRPLRPDPRNPCSGFRKAGVTLTDITWAGEAQRELLVPLPSERSEKLMATMDRINTRYGRNALFNARMGIEPRWRMRRELKSPNYTTRLSDIPPVFC